MSESNDEIDGGKASISSALFEELDDLCREIRYQCFHHCRWCDRHGNPVGPNRGRGHLPLDDDRPMIHRGGCGFDAIGKRLVALRDSSSNDPAHAVPAPDPKASKA